jgi:hypothetical protein
MIGDKRLEFVYVLEWADEAAQDAALARLHEPPGVECNQAPDVRPARRPGRCDRGPDATPDRLLSSDQVYYTLATVFVV